MRDVQKIVVGVDGSEGSLHALRWALTEARLRNAAVEMVNSWHVPYYPDMSGMITYPGDVMRESAEGVLADALSSVAADVGDVSVTSRTELGAAATALIAASKEADLLVVGRRGHGGFLTLVIGSVAQQVAAHASCPVVIVS